MTTLQKLSHEAVAALESAVNSPSSADWVLIAVACGILYRLGAALSARIQLGPVEVELLECDGTAVGVHALTAVLRERLANSGLAAPPAVPAGAPQTDLVSAIAASPIPHAAWIASLLGLLRPPPPLRYELSGTVFGKDKSSECGISFWLRPSRSGPALLKTLNRKTHKEAVESAAAKIYVHISKTAVGAFPAWTRWHSEEALRDYDEGGTQIEAGQLNAALSSLNRAASRERDNALAQLQLANLCEQMADDPYEKAAALRRYLDIAVEWPWLVEARYRVSVVASALCGSIPDSGLKRSELVAMLAMKQATTEPLEEWLNNLSTRESKSVRQLLHPWYTLLQQGRRRNQFEPRGRARRELKRNVSYSMRVRKKLNRDRDRGPRGPWASRLALGKEWLVRCWYLSPLRGRVSWQTHYIAACFYARLLALEKKHGAPPKREAWLHERAFSHLNRAIDEADSNLAKAWIDDKGDPDLESLRDLKDPDWQFVRSRLGSTKVEKPTQESRFVLRLYGAQLRDRYPADPRRA